MSSWEHLKDIPLEAISDDLMSARTYGVLRRNEVKNVWELVNACSNETILSFRYFGKKTCKEIIAILQSYGYQATILERYYEEHHYKK